MVKIYKAYIPHTVMYYSDLDSAKRWVERELKTSNKWRLRGGESWTIEDSDRSGYVHPIFIHFNREPDPIRKLAMLMLIGDPQALDAATDILGGVR